MLLVEKKFNLLVTVDKNTNTVNLKTEAPSITKKANTETVKIGQVVQYTVTGSIPGIQLDIQNTYIKFTMNYQQV